MMHRPVPVSQDWRDRATGELLPNPRNRLTFWRCLNCGNRWVGLPDSNDQGCPGRKT